MSDRRTNGRGKRVFLLSPAHCGGRRATLLLNPKFLLEPPMGEASARAADSERSLGTGANTSILVSVSDLAQRLRDPAGAPLADLFAFVSSLYFRGKVAYARAFTSMALVITPTRGLVPLDTPVTLEVMREFATVDIDPSDPRYREPLERDLARLATDGGPEAADTEFVLLGSVASGKYIEILLSYLGDRLLFPETFIGRGDMSRGGVMLRAARDGQELTYMRAAGAIRHGARPPKLEPVRWIK
jgi:hypothetical protein